MFIEITPIPSVRNQQRSCTISSVAAGNVGKVSHDAQDYPLICGHHLLHLPAPSRLQIRCLYHRQGRTQPRDQFPIVLTRCHTLCSEEVLSSPYPLSCFPKIVHGFV